MAEELAGFRSVASTPKTDLLGAASAYYVDVLRRFGASKSAVAAFGEVLETRILLASVFKSEVAISDEEKMGLLFYRYHAVLHDLHESASFD